MFLLKLEDVPATTGELWRVELHGRRVTPGLHRAEELRNQIRGEAGSFQIFFGSKANITAAHQALGVLALGPRDRREIRAVLYLLIDCVDFGLRVRVILGVVTRNSLFAVVRWIDRNHRERYAAGVYELLPVRVVVILDFAIANADLARILILQRLNGQGLLYFFPVGFAC